MADRHPPGDGLFHDRDAARQAFRPVHDLRVDGADGGPAARHAAGSAHAVASRALPRTEVTTKAAEGAGIGGAIGIVLGALAGAVATFGTSLAVPAMGLVLAGPVAAALAGAGAGAAAGGLLGSLVGLAIPEERVRRGARAVEDDDEWEPDEPETASPPWRDATGRDMRH